MLFNAPNQISCKSPKKVHILYQNCSVHLLREKNVLVIEKFKVVSKNDEVVFQVRLDSMQLLINSDLYEVVFGQKSNVHISIKFLSCHIIFEQDLEILATVTY